MGGRWVEPLVKMDMSIGKKGPVSQLGVFGKLGI
jgi:hypothetical protein